MSFSFLTDKLGDKLVERFRVSIRRVFYVLESSAEN